MDWLFGREFSLDDWREPALAVGIYSGNCFEFAIEYSRSRKWKKSGVIWWSLSDVFPMMFNYSVVDYEWKPKKPYYWIRQSQLPQCLVIVEADDGSLELFAANDTRQVFAGEYRITAVDAAGTAQDHAKGRFAGEANETVNPRKIDPPWGQSMLLVR